MSGEDSGPGTCPNSALGVEGDPDYGEVPEPWELLKSGPGTPGGPVSVECPHWLTLIPLQTLRRTAPITDCHRRG